MLLALETRKFDKAAPIREPLLARLRLLARARLALRVAERTLLAASAAAATLCVLTVFAVALGLVSSLVVVIAEAVRALFA